MDRVYRSQRVMHVMEDAEAIVEAAVYRDTLAILPPCRRLGSSRCATLETDRRARIIGDFVAGMTDRYAIAEHRRLFDATPELR